VANKSDQCTDDDFSSLGAYLVEKASHKKPLYRVSFGEIPFSALSAPAVYAAPEPDPSRRFVMPALSKTAVGQPESTERPDHRLLAEGDYITIKKQADGFTSIGWRFHASILFDRGRLFAFFSGLTLQRVKAIFITPDGVFGYNFSDQALTEVELDEAQESCIEGIDNDEMVFEGFEVSLLACKARVS
jgi:hypothetical protein